jgi:integrase
VSVSKLPSGRYRAQVYDPRVGGNVSVSRILGGRGTFRTRTEAKQARAKARERLQEIQAVGVTVLEWWERWTTDPLWARPKESTNLHNKERTKAFAREYANLPVAHVGDLVVAEWLAGGQHNGTVPALRAMFNDAASVKAGRLIPRSPFAGLGIEQSRGRRDQRPPTEQMMWSIIGHAGEVSGPDFAAWLQVGAFTGLRTTELDALAPESVDWARDRIMVVEQYNSKVRRFTLPKNGKRREAPLTAPAREALRSLPLDSRPTVQVAPGECGAGIHAGPRRFCFVNFRGQHWTASGRAYHWKAVRAAAGWDLSLYLATRHFAGWYMVNVLEMPSEDVAIALGHEDGGELVRRLYGHRDKDRALDRVVAAYKRIGRVHPFRTAHESARASGEAA